MKYGIIADLHTDPRLIIPAIGILKSEGADKLILNGDIQEVQDNLEKTRDYLALILTAAGKSGLETYVQPGNHEPFLAFQPVMDFFSDKFDNIMSISNVVRIEQPDHHLVFLPGSDISAGGEYFFGDDYLTGNYVITENGLVSFEEAKQKRIPASGFIVYQNVHDLRKNITSPEKTIAVCHVPRRFDNLEHAIDIVDLCEVTDNFTVKATHYADGDVYFGSLVQLRPGETKVSNMQFKKGNLVQKLIGQKLVNAGCPVEMKTMNKGNELLKSIYEELGVTKGVSAHFHESGHKACDSLGNHVNEGELVDSLFWNSGCMSNGKFGILTAENGKVSYRNIHLQDYVKE